MYVHVHVCDLHVHVCGIGMVASSDTDYSKNRYNLSPPVELVLVAERGEGSPFFPPVSGSVCLHRPVPLHRTRVEQVSCPVPTALYRARYLLPTWLATLYHIIHV